MINDEIKNIKLFMKRNKITYDELSAKSGIPISTLNYIFTGRTSNPRTDTLQAIKLALDLDEKKPLAHTIIEQVDELNLQDYNNLSEDEKRKIAEIFNATVSAFKKK